ncbi:MAG: hypothetical protein QOD73_3450, partial [Solirubrobacteraceae bacterium]|nr:hypothetical protein [Solirubrobacteraceae bacterium]
AVADGTEGAETAAPARPARRRGPAASPVARKLAEEHGIELAELAAVAGGRRIVREDVEAAIAARRTAPAERTAEAPPAPEATADPPPADAATDPAAAPTGEARVVALSSVERLIARRMTETKATVPEFTIRMTADMSACLEFRQRLRAERRRAPSLNDMIVKACGLALSRHPRVNGSYRDGEIELHGRVNVGIAVAGEGTLLVPTIFDADSRPLADIARESVRLVESARAGTLTPPELDGGTFTISNLGMFGVEEFSAIINAPQAAILAVGAVRRADGGALMTMTLTCDHRILYGADAAAFLGDVRRYLEEPLTMLL